MSARWQTDDATENDARDWWLSGAVLVAVLLAVTLLLLDVVPR